MTAEEKLKRAFAVENMYRLYKKYCPIWVLQNMKRIQKGSVSDVQFELVKEGTDKTKARNLR